ncbi:hypothetical protein C8Q72DRAFT_787603 [Fomitopsis betulina]|nr:hypothetical protein C8Q72DRAFT_787603 [Fomitopsis betulina]
MPSKAYCKLAERLPRHQASILIQLCTEHVLLQKYLHRIKKADSPICEQCSMVPETVYHYLHECLVYEEQREQLDGDAGEAAMQLQTLLNTPRMMKHLFQYIHSTRQFHTTYGDFALKPVRAMPKARTQHGQEKHR